MIPPGTSTLQLDRIDLADIHDPRRLARVVHRQLGHLEGAIPVIEIAEALGITEVRQDRLDGCEGLLLTDVRRSQGKILVNTGRGPQAARFSIAHELGHFLLERHQLGLGGILHCTLDDMRQVRSQRQHKKQEVEANEFAIGLLAPGYAIAGSLASEPGIDAVLSLRDRLDLSLEAAARCFVEGHDEPLAVVWAQDGRIRYVVRGPHFPWIKVERGDRLPSLSRSLQLVSTAPGSMTDMQEVAPIAWTGVSVLEMFEQARIGRDGHSLTLLWATLPDAEDES